MCNKSLSEVPTKITSRCHGLKLYGTDHPKNSGRTSEKARNHGFHLQWEVNQEMKQSLSCGKNYFPAFLNSSKTVKLVINSHGNFKGFDDLLCNSHKIKSLLHKLPLDRAVGKDGIFAERIFMLIQVCAIT